MKTFLKVMSLLQLVTAVLSGDTTAIAVAVSTDEK